MARVCIECAFPPTRASAFGRATAMHFRQTRSSASGQENVVHDASSKKSRRLEAKADADDRAVENLVQAGGIDATARAVVHPERAKADHGGDLVAGELPGVGIGGDRLPRERTAQPEAADVAAHEYLLAGRELMADANADQRIDPLHDARMGDRDAGRTLD